MTILSELEIKQIREGKRVFSWEGMLDVLETVEALRTRLKEAEEKLELLPCGHRRVDWVEHEIRNGLCQVCNTNHREPQDHPFQEGRCAACARDSAREKGLREEIAKHCLVPSFAGTPRCECGLFFNHFHPAAVEEWKRHIRTLTLATTDAPSKETK